jgi:hypothetical protein
MPRFNQHHYGCFLTARGGGRGSCSLLVLSSNFQNFIRLKDIRVTGDPGLGDTGIRGLGTKGRITNADV